MICSLDLPLPLPALTDLVWGTSDHINSHTSSNDDNFQALNFDRTVPQGNEANIPTEI